MNNNGIVALIEAIIFLCSCEGGITQPNSSNISSTQDQQAAQTILAQNSALKKAVISYGINPYSIYEMETGFVINGDMVISKEHLSEKSTTGLVLAKSTATFDDRIEISQYFASEVYPSPGEVGNIRIYYDASLSANQKKAAEFAASTWSSVSGSMVKFVEVTSSSLADVIVRSLPTASFNNFCSFNAVACAELPWGRKIGLSNFDNSGSPQYVILETIASPYVPYALADLKSITLHEFGHILGLLDETDHSADGYYTRQQVPGTLGPDCGSIMFNNNNNSCPDNNRTVLSANDKIAIKWLYPSTTYPYISSVGELIGPNGVPLNFGLTTSFRQSGNWFVALTSGGYLWGKDGINGIWILLSSSIKSFQLVGTRIAALRSDNTLFTKERNLHSNWVQQISNVSKYQLEGSRIAVLLNGGIFCVKEGSQSALWQTLASGVVDFLLQGKTVSVLNGNRAMALKTGGLSAIWMNDFTSPGVYAWDISGSNIFVIMNDRNVFAKAGFTSAWQLVGQQGEKIHMSGSRTALVTTTNGLYAMDGITSWTALLANVADCRLYGNDIV
ncbi:MAG: hypothetical protein M0P13_12465, partial [Fibrobacteraceae bacterium]|nr:hypothetical protein [Fibrobacteraceae bacterium]